MVISAVLMSACAIGGQSQPTDWSQQSSASSGGGLQELVGAARREGALNLAGTPDEWNIGLRSAFFAKYGITISVSPAVDDASQLADHELDVYNLGVDSAAGHTSQFAPYLVFYWTEVPPALKSPKAYWSASCGGYIAVAYDAERVHAITSLADLAQAPYEVQVPDDPLDGNEKVATAAALSLESGGSADDVAPGVAYLQRLNSDGRLVQPSDSFAPVVIGWSYGVPRGYARYALTPTVAAYEVLAVNRTAPHPAAARLWDEFVMSDTGQNTCMHYDARPARIDAMRSDGVLDVQAAATLDQMPHASVMLTAGQMAAARVYVTANWPSLPGS